MSFKPLKLKEINLVDLPKMMEDKDTVIFFRKHFKKGQKPIEIFKVV